MRLILADLVSVMPDLQDNDVDLSACQDEAPYLTGLDSLKSQGQLLRQRLNQSASQHTAQFNTPSPVPVLQMRQQQLSRGQCIHKRIVGGIGGQVVTLTAAL